MKGADNFCTGFIHVSCSLCILASHLVLEQLNRVMQLAYEAFLIPLPQRCRTTLADWMLIPETLSGCQLPHCTAVPRAVLAISRAES